MHPRQFFDLAIVLKGGPASPISPASYRSAISRSYYAAFNVGVETLKTIGIQLGDGPAAHGQLRNCLGASKDADFEDAGDHVRRLHGRRLRADYRMDDTGAETRVEAELACREAAEAIKVFEESLSDPKSKDTAVMAMKEYARKILGVRVT